LLTSTPAFLLLLPLLLLPGLCNADVLEATLSGIESNQLARNAGVTRASVQAV
jgi:hypothetical protein